MKNKYFLFFCLLLSIKIFAQCPTDPITIRTQEDIDNYRADYPNCNEVCPPGNIIISTQDDLNNFKNNFPGCSHLSYNLFLSSEDITSLEPLDEVVTIEGSLVIGYLSGTSVVNLTGLNNLTQVGGLSVQENNKLKNLIGLESLTRVSGILSVSGNTQLVDLEGIESLSIVDKSVIINSNFNLLNLNGLGSLETINENLTIEFNTGLRNLEGLSNLKEVLGGVSVSFNSNILSLKGLESLSSISGFLQIEDNEKLLNVEGLTDLQSISSFTTIKRNPYLQNLEGLNSLEKVGSILEISQNELLESVIGLESLSSVYRLEVTSNSFLKSLSGLSGLAEITDSLIITFNPKLNECDLPFFCEYIQNDQGEFNISNNAEGCNSKTEILEKCIYLCPREDVVLQSQEEVDNFSAIFENCSGLDYNLTITGSNISNLLGLESISSIEGDLTISNTSLTTLNGLAIETLGGAINIDNNQQLTDIEAIQGIDFNKVKDFSLTDNSLLTECSISFLCQFLSKGEGVNISGNGNGCNNEEAIFSSCSNQCPDGGLSLSFLTQSEIDNFAQQYPDCTIIRDFIRINGSTINNLEGLNNLSSILGNLIIESTNINTLNGLENLRRVDGEIFISENTELIDIQAISDIQPENIESIEITKNPQLSSCSLPNFCNYLFNQIGNLTISENSINCSSESDIQAVCEVEQCPSSSIILTSQEEVDNFLLQYPNCTDINVDIFVQGNDIVNLNAFKNIEKIGPASRFWIGSNNFLSNRTSLEDLDGLQNLQTVEGTLRINDNPLLKSLNGLQSLQIAKNLYIESNPQLINLDGLNNLSEVTSSFLIFQNTKLKNFRGLDNLKSIGIDLIDNTFSTTFTVSGNSSLENFDGLQNLEFVKSLYVGQNSINNFEGLSGLTEISGDFNISNNNILKNFEGLSNLTSIKGELEIEDNLSIIDLEGLESLERVEGGVRMYNNRSLVNLNGLSNLNFIGGGLQIDYHLCLTSFSGISKLQTIEGNLIVDSNDNIINFNGFENLQTIRTGFFKISNNNSLQSLDGLNEIKFDGEINFVMILDNISLTDISSFNNFSFLDISSLRIEDNPNLEICSYFPICNYINENPSQAQISGNAIGCSSEEEILENCDDVLNSIFGKLEFSEMMSDCGSVNSTPINNIRVNTTDGISTYSTFTNNDGGYKLLTPSGNYTTDVSLDDNNYTISPESYEVVFDDFDESYEKDFCIIANQEINDVDVVLIPLSDARPGFDANYRIVFENKGTTIQSGTISLSYDNDKIALIIASLPIDQQNLNTLEWSYDNLLPFEQRFIDLTFNVIAPPVVNIEDILPYETKITYSNNLEDYTFNFDQRVIGSFDPNDKTVIEGESISFEDVDNFLHYVIRFQNTGTASAINVRIVDLLDDNLNWDTFVPISSSHDYNLQITNNNKLEFVFDGINLPDENSDEEGSNGFVSFKIKPKSDIEIGEIIRGKAEIFFDFNLPIITNTVETEIVDQVLSAETNKISDLNKTYIYPNPTENCIRIKIKNNALSGLFFSITDTQGRRFISGYKHLEFSGDFKIDLQNLSSGIYMLNIKNHKGINETMKIIKK